MVKPAGKDLLNEKNFLDFVRNGQKYNTPNGVRSTAAVNGSQQWAATTHTVSDILQGNLSEVNPQDQLLVLNKGLTDSLKLFAGTPENPQGFSTFTNTIPNISKSAAGGSAGGSAGGVGFGATVEESWVRRLPHKHENGALIWMPEGKASNEMHLPTSGNLEEDIAQHIQYPGLPPNQQHPWYMDRVGGGIGGEVNNLPSGPDEADTILRENKDAPGQNGAFGYLDPLEEQFYISMAWPYRGTRQKWLKAGLPQMADIADSLSQSEHYKGRRVLVFSVDTKRAVVCTPAEWGPNPYYSNGAVTRNSILGYNAGLSPDVMYALGIVRGQKILLGWMDDDTPLGPYGRGGLSPTGMAGRFVQLALEQRGKTYIVNHPPFSQINSDDPPSFDCSGLTMWAALKVGYVPPENYIGKDWSYSVTQLNMIKNAGTVMSREQALATPGALLCRLPKGDRSGHVAISIGDGNIIHAASPAVGVVIGSPSHYDLYGMLPGMEVATAVESAARGVLDAVR